MPSRQSAARSWSLRFGEGVDETTIEVATQHGIAHGRLDVFLSSPTVALVIESKIDSTHDQGQLAKYLTWIEAEHAHKPLCGLLTLTAVRRRGRPRISHLLPSGELGRRASLWEDLHARLAPIIALGSDLGGRLVGEFLEMLAAEGLVPIQPLSENELDTAWADGWRVVMRYRDFFQACKGSIAEALDAELISSKSDRGDWVWQDYRLTGSARLAVGLFRERRVREGTGLRAIGQAYRLDGGQDRRPRSQRNA
jgi:hypothetical protein